MKYSATAKLSARIHEGGLILKSINIALIGYKFMGKAHSHAWRDVTRFFNPDVRPTLKVVCGRNEGPLTEFAQRWGWEETATDWREVVTRSDIDIVDISTPTCLHHDIAIAAARAGKHIFCEKPFSLNLAEANDMCEAASNAKIVNYVNHNYRRVPAVALAKQFIGEGKIGRIFHWRGAYLQSWIIDPEFPLTWHLRKETAGAGPHFDLNSHSVDLARYLVGDITKVSAMMSHFVRERPVDTSDSGGAFTAISQTGEKGAVTVDDAAFMLAEFENGAMGSFESSRFAAGRLNFNSFEIYGDRGSLSFNLERINELEYCSLEDPVGERGFRTIQTTELVHPYMSHWWPPGHIIGYEHTFIHAVSDFLDAITKGVPVHPNFQDGMEVMRILEAGLDSAANGCCVNLPPRGRQ